MMMVCNHSARDFRGATWQICLIVAGVLCAIAFSSPQSGKAWAAPVSGNLMIKAQVEDACYVNTSGAGSVSGAVMDFGTLTTLSADSDAATNGSGGAQLQVLCTTGTSYLLGVDAGLHARSGQRYMRPVSGTGELPYNLYINNTRTTQPRGSGGVIAVGIGRGIPLAYTLYGRIPAGTPLPEAGQYTDTVTLTVSW